MAVQERLPNGRVLLEGMGLSLERLQSGSKAAVSLPIVRALLCAAASALAFDPDFYLNTYPDIRHAYEVGKIKDLRTHFIEFGYLEGRMGALPEFDEEFYKRAYPDVAAAIAEGSVTSARDHYIHSGSFEGRNANESMVEPNRQWSDLLRSF